MTADEVIDKLNEERDRLVKLNNMKYPEYDPYINGWDDCIDWLENHIELLSACC